MPALEKKNEAVQLPLFKNGVTLQWFTVEMSGALNSKLAATAQGIPSPVVKALEAIQSRVSVEVVGNTITGAGGANSAFRIGVAAVGGDYPTDNYDGLAGTETLAAFLQTLVRAVTTAGGATIQGIVMSQSTVTSFTI
jgi:hypothetical protein